MLSKPDQSSERTELAADRTILANERTYSAWVRTGFTAIAAGLGAVKLLGDTLPPWTLLTVSTVCIAYGGFAFVAGAWRYRHTHHAHAHRDTPQIPFGLVVLANALLLGAAMAALFGLFAGS